MSDNTDKHVISFEYIVQYAQFRFLKNMDVAFGQNFNYNVLILENIKVYEPWNTNIELSKHNI